MRYITLFLLLAFVPCRAQSPSELSGSLINGRFWNASAKNEKAMYVTGSIDGIRIAQQGKPLATASVGDRMKELDKLYNEGENLNIPVIWAIAYYVEIKLKGETPSAVLENSLIALRKQAAALK